MLTSRIVDQYMSLKNVSQLQAKFLYLEIAKSLPLYGSSLFPVNYMGFWSFGENVYLAVSHYGIDLVQIPSKDVIMTFSYEEIINFYSEEDNLSILIHKTGIDVEDVDMDNEELFMFTTDYAEEAISLMREYAPAKVFKVL
jgi:hypothetical protein